VSHAPPYQPATTCPPRFPTVEPSSPKGDAAQGKPSQRSLHGQQQAELFLESVVLRESTLSNSPILPYVRIIVWLIEGITLSRAELVAILSRVLRQHRFAYRRKIDYVLGFLHQHPP
jgi:hypothetical protein